MRLPSNLGTEHGDMMSFLELTTQVERVELRPRLVPRKKIVNGVEYVETGFGHHGSRGGRCRCESLTRWLVVCIESSDDLEQRRIDRGPVAPGLQ